MEVLLGEDLEHPTIIPITRVEVAALSEGDALRSFLQNKTFRRDLFALEAPLKKDSYFFGREELVAEIVERCRSGQNTGLFGLRRIGKTSVMFAVGRRLVDGRISGFTYLDSSNPSIYLGRWWETLQEIAGQIARPLALERARRSRIRALSTSYEERAAAKAFKADIEELFQYFAGGRLVLAIDEVENLSFGISPNESWNSDFLPFWQTLRSIHQDTAGKFCFFIAGVNPRCVETDVIDTFDNPLFSTVKDLYLPPFDRARVRDMVRRLSRYMGLRPEEALYDSLVAEYGGHPFLCRQACSHLADQIKTRPAALTASLLTAQRSRINRRLHKNVRQILNVLQLWYPEEYNALCELATGDRDYLSEYLEIEPAFAQHLEGYGLVAFEDEGPKFTIGLVQEFLRNETRKRRELGVARYYSSEGRPAIEDIRTEISQRRNHIETKLRELASITMRQLHGDKCFEKALAGIDPDRAARLSNYSYTDVWSNLYFSELARICARNWSAFKNFFRCDPTEFEKWASQINKCRIDAHARELSEDDLAYLRVCFGRFEKSLEIL